MLKFLTIPFNLLFNSIRLLFESIFDKPKGDAESLTELDDFFEAEVEKISEEKMDLAYNSGISLLQEITDGMKVINTRTTLLLAYLAAIIATFLPLLLASNVFNYVGISLYIWFILAGYLILIFVIAYLLPSPHLTKPTHNEPLAIINKHTFMNDIKLAKFMEINEIQKRIEVNNEVQKRAAKYLQNSIVAAFIIPVAILGVYLLG